MCDRPNLLLDILVEVGRVWVWAALVIIARELIVVSLRGLVALDGTTVPPPIRSIRALW